VDVDRFWALMEQANSPQELHGLLAGLPDGELVSFERLHAVRMDEAYDWGLWGAAYVIDGGCSDDGFEYFRAYLLSLGKAVFARALSDPDSLADIEFADGDEWEEWMSPTMMVIHARTGQYDFAAPPDADRLAPREPSGTSWEEDDLPSLYPRLTAQYG
jgi:hypothetical protein